MDRLDAAVATAILGLDTLWGGNVMDPSGTGRFIADSWFSDAPLPEAYTLPAAAAVRAAGGLSASQPDREAIDAYLAAVDLARAIAEVRAHAADLPALRAAYLLNLADSCGLMWALALERLGQGEPVSFARAVLASCGEPPTPSNPRSKRERLAALLGAAPDDLVEAADAWRRDRLVPRDSIRTLAGAFIAELDALCQKNLLPHLPARLHEVPRANIEFLPIEDAWFSGSMNYLGRERDEAGRPLYEATYEINASLEISVPEFAQLVSHEVVPGHVTTFALLQHLDHLGEIGFEATVQTMNTRGATLSEGIANNALLIAYGVTEIEELPDEDLQIGLLLALLQDDAKNQAAWLTWQEGWPQEEVAPLLRREFLVSEERAGKLSGAWARHPLMGRLYLPCYRAGTEKVAALRRLHPPGRLLPALFGAQGLVDITTLDLVLTRG
ncbi:MAG TPA: hypothetical protein VLA75_07440 [Thermoanaerobaculia bacterium]|nr:hypothetical protein [Thermoanaerobaculia bacterium]